MAPRDNYTFANQSAIPSPLDEQLPAFFKSWDDPHTTTHDYLKLFHPTQGQLVFGVTTTGRDAIRSFRGAMVDPAKGPVVNLEHTLEKCFVVAGGAGEGRQEVIVNGSLWYELKNGRKVDCDFASLIRFAKAEGDGEGGLLAEFYEVYLDATELMGAIKEMNEAAE